VTHTVDDSFWICFKYGIGLQTVFNTILLQHIVSFIKKIIFLWSISSEAGRVLGYHNTVQK